MRNLFIPKGGITAKNYDQVKRTLDKASAMLAKRDEYAVAVGNLASAWAGLDHRVDELFEPLLNCSEEKVACITVENIATRCEMLKKLLHTERLPSKWTAWVEGLLNRTANELAPLRNRFIHDSWGMSKTGFLRIDKRAKVGKVQSRQRPKLTYKTEHPTSVEDVYKLTMCVGTVSFALWAATHTLRLWRLEGRRLRLSRQWLPASMPTARCSNMIVNGSAPHRPSVRLTYEYD